jgi:hypothetical protein
MSAQGNELTLVGGSTNFGRNLARGHLGNESDAIEDDLDPNKFAYLVSQRVCGCDLVSYQRE